MTADAAVPRRRRRRRRAGGRGQEPAAAPTEATSAPVPAPAASTPRTSEPTAAKAKRRRSAKDASAERSLRDIVGAGRSQVGVSGALRARDANRPTDEDVAEAERDIVIIRRNWKPPDSPPR